MEKIEKFQFPLLGALLLAELPHNTRSFTKCVYYLPAPQELGRELIDMSILADRNNLTYLESPYGEGSVIFFGIAEHAYRTAEKAGRQKMREFFSQKEAIISALQEQGKNRVVIVCTKKTLAHVVSFRRVLGVPEAIDWPDVVRPVAIAVQQGDDIRFFETSTDKNVAKRQMWQSVSSSRCLAKRPSVKKKQTLFSR